MDYRYPLAKQTIDEVDIQSLIEWLSQYPVPQLTMGKLVKEFERRWAELIGTKYAVFVNSGSSANLLMLYALMTSGLLTRGMKVLVPAVGWGTTIAPVLQLGLVPILVDVDEETFGMDPDEVLRILKVTPNVGALFCVHALGVPCKVKELKQICRDNDIVFLEDTCAALGSELDIDKKLGSYGGASSFSFYFGHQLSTIEGGMINTDNQMMYEHLLMARSHGWVKDLPKDRQDHYFDSFGIDSFHSPFTFIIPGFNLRGTDLQAQIGLNQLDKAKWVFSRRDENHMRYHMNLSSALGNKLLIQKPRGNLISSISFGAVCKNPSDRKRVVDALVNNSIETRLYSAGNLGRHPFWESYFGRKQSCYIADMIHDGGFFLPNYPELELEDVDYISGVVASALR